MADSTSNDAKNNPKVSELTEEEIETRRKKFYETQEKLQSIKSGMKLLSNLYGEARGLLNDALARLRRTSLQLNYLHDHTLSDGGILSSVGLNKILGSIEGTLEEIRDLTTYVTDSVEAVNKTNGIIMTLERRVFRLKALISSINQPNQGISMTDLEPNQLDERMIDFQNKYEEIMEELTRFLGHRKVSLVKLCDMYETFTYQMIEQLCISEMENIVMPDESDAPTAQTTTSESKNEEPYEETIFKMIELAKLESVEIDLLDIFDRIEKYALEKCNPEDLDRTITKKDELQEFFQRLDSTMESKEVPKLLPEDLDPHLPDKFSTELKNDEEPKNNEEPDNNKEPQNNEEPTKNKELESNEEPENNEEPTKTTKNPQKMKNSKAMKNLQKQ